MFCGSDRDLALQYLVAMAALPPPSQKLGKKEDDLFRVVVQCYEKKDYRRGVKTADSILKKYPNHGETQAMKGLLLNCLGRKEEAYELVKLGLKNHVQSHVCWHVYGLLYRSDSNYKEACKCYMNALRINKDNQNILRDLSFLQIQVRLWPRYSSTPGSVPPDSTPFPISHAKAQLNLITSCAVMPLAISPNHWSLRTQMRDVQGFVASRDRILQAKPNQKSNWLGSAVASFIAGDHNRAYDLLQRCNEAFPADKTEAYMDSEVLLFQNKCLEAQGKLEEALAHLQQHETSITDKLSLKIKRAELTLRLGRFPEAQAMWLGLVKEQGENYKFHRGLQVAHLQLDPAVCMELLALKRLELPSTVLELDAAQRTMLLDLYRSGEIRASCIKRIELSLLAPESAEFRAALDKHMRKSMQSGQPALYHDVCALVRQADPRAPGRHIYVRNAADFRMNVAAQVAIDLVNGYVDNLRRNGTFDAAPQADAVAEPPTCLLWAMFLQCHLLEMCGELSMALSVIDECIAHTPTAPDMILKKARLLKKAGAVSQAAVVCDEGRQLDLQDRYLNNKACKYLLRAGRIDDALDTISMFAKHDGTDINRYLADQQCNWFELEAAEAFARKRQWGPALKKFYSVQTHFGDYVEDMFDFHGYGVRKSTLRAYVDILAMQDDVYSHKFYQRACRGALTIFLHLLDEPEDIDGLGHLSSLERKKERAKRKKLKQRESKAEEEREKERQEEAKRFGGGAGGGGAASSKDADEVKDTDPQGESLLQKNFLAEATAWCSRLSSRISICDPETQALVAEVALRRGKPVLAVRAAACGLRKAPMNPALLPVFVKTVRRARGMKGKGPMAPFTMHEHVAAVVEEEISDILGGADLAAFVSAFVSEARLPGASLTLKIGAARCISIMDPSAAGKQAAAALFEGEEPWQGNNATLSEAINVIKVRCLNLDHHQKLFLC